MIVKFKRNKNPQLCSVQFNDLTQGQMLAISNALASWKTPTANDIRLALQREIQSKQDNPELNQDLFDALKRPQFPYADLIPI